MMRGFLSMYSPAYPSTIVYMLQSDEYHILPFLKWYWRTTNFKQVMYRRQLDRTGIAKLLEAFMVVGIVAQILLALGLIYRGLTGNNTQILIGLSLLISYPVIWAHVVTLPTFLGRITVINKRNKKLSAQTQLLFSAHRAMVIAIAGSYGKTSMKELLLTVLSEGKKVEATPANKNVITEHAKFARKLNGSEDILIVEYGEEKPGDIAKFAEISRPNYGIITGLAPAHLDKYKTLQAAGKDIFSLGQFIESDKTYVNGDSQAAEDYIKKTYHIYSHNGIDNNRVSDVKVDLDGTKFKLKLKSQSYNLHSQLIGRHHIGPLCAAVALAEELGLSKNQIIKGVAKTKPFHHRMEPKLIAGAWVLDDTYNGTIEGMKAGLELLSELSAKRKIYITPGLVDQGAESGKIHSRLGQLIAKAKPDIVILMKNSNTKYIEHGLEIGNYKGILNIQLQPLEYYQNLDKVVAAGDLVMMQNDLPDQYN